MKQLASISPHERKFVVVKSEFDIKELRGEFSFKERHLQSLDQVNSFTKNNLIKYAKKHLKEYNAGGLLIQYVRVSETTGLSFPPGHPQLNTLYVIHPTDNDLYYPASEFHHKVFEHKFSEVTSLLMALGAKEIYASHVRGWGREFAGVSVSAEFNSKLNGSDSIIYHSVFSPSKDFSPYVPENLKWLSYESAWMEVVKGRLQFNLNKFELKLNYTEDFGVNSNLKSGAEYLNIGLGGSFRKHDSTIWDISGTF